MNVPGAGSPVWLALSLFSAAWSAIFTAISGIVVTLARGNTPLVVLSVATAALFGLAFGIFRTIVAYG